MSKPAVKGAKFPSLSKVVGAAIIVGVLLVAFTLVLNGRLNARLSDYEAEYEEAEKLTTPTARLPKIMQSLREGDYTAIKNATKLTELEYYTDSALAKWLEEQYGDMIPQEIELVSETDTDAVVSFTTSTGEHTLALTMYENDWVPVPEYETAAYALIIPYGINVTMNGLHLNPKDAELMSEDTELTEGTDAGLLCVYRFNELLSRPEYVYDLKPNEYTLEETDTATKVKVVFEHSEEAARCAGEAALAVAECVSLEAESIDRTYVAGAYVPPIYDGVYLKHTQVSYGEPLLTELPEYVGYDHRAFDVTITYTLIAERELEDEEGNITTQTNNVGTYELSMRMLMRNDGDVWKLVKTDGFAVSEVGK